MDSYCNQKFINMQLLVERQELSSCCVAELKKIDVKWLEKNKTNLFNTDEIVEDRKNMLQNMHVPSCEVCYNAEKKGRLSQRKIKNGEQRIITDLNCEPKEISLSLDTACNLTCSYCCKNNSSAWLRDIANNGMYFDDNRNKITSYDKLLIKAGHKMTKKSKNYKLILESVLNYKNTDYINILGGEPFLNKDLISIVNNVNGLVKIITGLGVNKQKFENILKLINKENLIVCVSCENINEFYEFNRYGISFYNFCQNLDLLKKYNIKFHFNSVISNVTIFGFKSFLDYFQDFEIFTSNCIDPPYLIPCLLDEKSKKIIRDTDFGRHTQFVHKAIEGEFSVSEKIKANIFISEFAKRRNLNLEIFPLHFLEWLRN